MSTPLPVQDLSPIPGEDPSADSQPQEDPRLEQVKNYVTNIVREIDRQERPTREVMIKIWKYLDLLWTGIANFYWNSTTNQWQPITYDDVRHLSESADIDPTLLNKTVNMIRPYGESIVGVLTTSLPRNKYYPSDSDSVDDINTAKAYSNIEKKIAQDNYLKTKLVQMIVALLNGGFFGAYNYSHSDEKYGTVTQDIITNKRYRISDYSCSDCGYSILTDKLDLSTLDESKGVEQGLAGSINEESEDAEMAEDKEGYQEEEQLEAQIEAMTCPQCGMIAPPITTQNETTEPVVTGKQILPKSRQIIEIYGPLELKIPTHAARKEDVIWCILEKEVHEAKMRTMYPKHRDQIKAGSHTDLAYDRWARSQYENMGELNQYYVTERKVWLRPEAYEMLGDEDAKDLLCELYPSGLMAVFSDPDFLFCEAADLDDCWTFSCNPIFKRLYGDPLLKPAIPLQETTNDMFQLELEVMRHSISMLFADPAHFDFETFKNTKAQPGLVYPMKPGVNKDLSQVFYETRTASLPKEVEGLEAKVEKYFQFVLGVFPSIFGGPSSGGSKTLGEYEQSRGQALQRLNINPWEIINVAYAELMAKAVKAYADDLLEDESYVIAKGNNFTNVWIRKSNLQGRIGEVRPELSDQFPVSFGQKKAAWLELLQLNNPVIIQTLFHPENVHLLDEILSIDDLYIPGDDQRNKQLEEIREIISTPPGIGGVDPKTGQPIPVNAVPIEPVDDDNIHIQVLSAYICSEVGQTLKQENPEAYMHLLLHLEAHQVRLQQQMMAEAAQANANGGNDNGGNDVTPPEKGN